MSIRSVTAQLMGDPRPDREALSERIRARLGLDDDQGPTPSVLEVLEVLAEGPLTFAELASDIGLSLAASTERANQALRAGLIGKAGRPARLFLTPDGEALIR